MTYSSSTSPSSPSKTYSFQAANTHELENLGPDHSKEGSENNATSLEGSLDQLLERSLRDDMQFSDVIQSAPQRQFDNDQANIRNCRFRSIRLSQPARKVHIDLMSAENTTPGEVIFETVAGNTDHNSPIFEAKIKGLKGPCAVHRDTYFQLSAGTGEIIQSKAESAQFRCRYLAPQDVEQHVLSLQPKPYEIAMNTCQGGFPGNVRLHVFPLLDFSAKISIDHSIAIQSTSRDNGSKEGSFPIRMAIDGTYDDQAIKWSSEVKSIALTLQNLSEVQSEIRAIIASIATKSIDDVDSDGPVIDFQLTNLRYEAIAGFPAVDIAYDIQVSMAPLFSTQFSCNIMQSLAAIISGTSAKKLLYEGRKTSRSGVGEMVFFTNGTLSGQINASKQIGRGLETSNGSMQSHLYFEVKAPRLGKLNYQIIAVRGPASVSRSACCSTRLSILNSGHQGAQLSMSAVFEGLEISQIINGNLSKRRIFGGTKTVRSSHSAATENSPANQSPEGFTGLSEIVLAEGKTLFEQTIPLIQ